MEIHHILEHKDRPPITIKENSTIEEALKLMNENHIGALIVENKQSKLAGILTERDILYKLGDNFNKDLTHKKVSEAMTKADNLIIGHKEDTIGYAMNVFTKNKIRHLPVMEGDAVVGMVSIGDLVKALLEDTEFENKMLKDYVAGSL